MTAASDREKYMIKKIKYITVILFLFLILFLTKPQVLNSVAKADPGSEVITVYPGEGTISEALENCSDGDIIELGSGIYAEPEETFPLTVTRCITIRAQEGAAPIIDAPELEAAFRIEADGVTLESLDIRFRRTGIYAIGDDMTLENCSIILADETWRVSSCGMWCGGIYRMTLRDCDFTGCGVSLAGPPLSESSKGLPVLTGLFEVGEDPDYFTTHTIEGCRVNGKQLFYAASLPDVTAPEDAGEIICCGCGSVTVRNADISDCSMGMCLVYNGRTTVENCRADRCGIFGIYVAKSSDVDVNGCYTEGTNHGMDFRADRNVLIRNCTAGSCQQGIFFSSVDDSVMKDCVVTGTRQGFFMANGSGNSMIGCFASGCENGCHLEKESRVLMASCTIENCSVCGVRLDRTSVTVAGNILQNNWVAMSAYGEQPLNIVSNLFKDNKSCGLYLKNIGFSRICDNNFEDSGTYSALAVEKMENSIWIGNLMDIPADFSGVSGGFSLID